MLRLATGTTGVVTVSVLFAGCGSNSVAATVTVLVMVPVGGAMMRVDHHCAAADAQRGHGEGDRCAGVLESVAPPLVATTPPKVAPPWITSVITTLLAVLGPVGHRHRVGHDLAGEDRDGRRRLAHHQVGSNAVTVTVVLAVLFAVVAIRLIRADRDRVGDQAGRRATTV
jgi:hypothetical protein